MGSCAAASPRWLLFIQAQALKRAASRTAGRRRVGRDRKSTRLNSSHRQISYAVLCLKKKNTHTHITSVSLHDTQTAPVYQYVIHQTEFQFISSLVSPRLYHASLHCLHRHLIPPAFAM